jgi:hypothetical protein
MMFWRKKEQREQHEANDESIDITKAALNAYEQDREWREQRLVRTNRRLFFDCFGVYPDSIEKKGSNQCLATYQDYSFALTEGQWPELIWACSQCGRTHLYSVHDLPSLGYALAHKYMTCTNE